MRKKVFIFSQMGLPLQILCSGRPSIRYQSLSYRCCVSSVHSLPAIVSQPQLASRYPIILKARGRYSVGPVPHNRLPAGKLFDLVAASLPPAPEY